MRKVKTATGVPEIETQHHGGPSVRHACRGQHQPRAPWPTGCSRLGTPAAMPDLSRATIRNFFGDGHSVAVYLQCETGSETSSVFEVSGWNQPM